MVSPKAKISSKAKTNTNLTNNNLNPSSQAAAKKPSFGSTSVSGVKPPAGKRFTSNDKSPISREIMRKGSECTDEFDLREDSDKVHVNRMPVVDHTLHNGPGSISFKSGAKSNSASRMEESRAAKKP